MHRRDSTLPCITSPYTAASTNVFQMEPSAATKSTEIEYKRGNKKPFYHALRSAFTLVKLRAEGQGGEGELENRANSSASPSRVKAKVSLVRSPRK